MMAEGTNGKTLQWLGQSLDLILCCLVVLGWPVNGRLLLFLFLHTLLLLSCPSLPCSLSPPLSYSYLYRRVDIDVRLYVS